jgi:crotonobetainyl-CoA:carnitine CoA-transferase CaiB-like acyl-CoA transferase
MTSISNFGQTGPYRNWEGVDLTLYAMGGNMWGSGDPELQPLKTAGRMAGFHVGYAAALATALALVNADIRGEGEQVDVSYFEVSLQSIDSRMQKLLGYQYNNKVPMRISPSAALGLGSGVFPCVDGLFMMTAGAAQFPPLARMIEADYLLEQPEWSTVAARSRPEAAEEFEAILIPWTITRTRKEVQQKCMEFGVLGAPVNTIADLLADDDFNIPAYWQTIDHPATGPLTYPGYQFHIHTEDGETMHARRAAPLLGQHTVEVLKELGIEGEEIGLLRSQGVI